MYYNVLCLTFKISGKTGIQTTLNIYAQNDDDIIKNTTERLNGIFQKCENFVRTEDEKNNCKIIKFPSKRVITGR